MRGSGSRLLAALLMLGLAASAAAAGTDWPTTGGGLASQRYSPLTQIRKDNVTQLTPLWTYHSGDLSRGDKSHGGTALQVTPLEVEGTLYFCTPYNRVIALDAQTGAEKWTFDPHPRLKGVYTPVCRGVAYWNGGQPPRSVTPHVRS